MTTSTHCRAGKSLQKSCAVPQALPTVCWSVALGQTLASQGAVPQSYTGVVGVEGTLGSARAAAEITLVQSADCVTRDGTRQRTEAMISGFGILRSRLGSRQSFTYTFEPLESFSYPSRQQSRERTPGALLQEKIAFLPSYGTQSRNAAISFHFHFATD
jgi:hypothetical protein